jgi:hypothetical protein
VLHWVLGGWQLSGILTACSGLPTNFTTSGATLAAPGNTQRPNVAGTPEVIGDIGPGQKYFDTSVFSTPAQSTWGNMRRDDTVGSFASGRGGAWRALPVAANVPVRHLG